MPDGVTWRVRVLRETQTAPRPGRYRGYECDECLALQAATHAGWAPRE